MANKKIIWGAVGEKRYETGVSKGVLYPRSAAGEYTLGVAWNGLTNISESPSGAEVTKHYADNTVYASIQGKEEFGATIEAFMYPKEFGACDGSISIIPGLSAHQQQRNVFGFSYVTLVGNDVAGLDYGYQLHLVYGALAAPSEKSRATVNESPEPGTFSWEITTTPVEIPGFKSAAHLTIDSLTTPADKMKIIEDVLYGTELLDPRMPMPAEVITLLTVTAG